MKKESWQSGKRGETGSLMRVGQFDPDQKLILARVLLGVEDGKKNIGPNIGDKNNTLRDHNITVYPARWD